MKLLNRLDLTLILILVLIATIFVAIWFREGHLFIGAEEGAGFYNIEYELKHSISTVWMEQFLGLPYFSELSKWPFFSLLGALNKLGISSFFLQVGTFFLILSGASISCYLLFRMILTDLYKPRLSAFIGALFYLVNPYVISQVWMRGLYTQFFAYIYFPSFFLLFGLFIKTKKIIFLLLALTLSFFLAPAMGNPSYLISLWTLIGCYFVFSILQVNSFLQTIRLVLFFLAFLAIWIVLNSWWLLATVIYAGQVYLAQGSVFDNSLESLIAVSNQNSFLSIIRLLHQLHFDSLPVYGQFYKNPITILISFFPVLVLAFSLRFKKNKSWQFFALLFSLGLIISLGASPPFGEAFIYFFQQIPILQVFRNPYEKFGIVYLIAYSGVIVFGISSILSKINKSSKKILLFLFALFAYFGIFNWPLWTGTVIDWGTQAEIPISYQQIDKTIKTQSVIPNRIFFLPFLSDLGASYNWESGEYHGNDPIFQLIDYPVITQTGKSPYLNFVKQYLESMDLTGSLSLLRSEYVVNRLDVNSTRRDKKHLNYFTKNYFIPDLKSAKNICSDIQKAENGFRCSVVKENRDWNDIHFLDVELSAAVPSYVEVYIQDAHDVRSRWSGKGISDYQYIPDQNKTPKLIRIYLSNPIENADLDYSNISLVEIHVKPVLNSDQNLQAQINHISANRGILTNARGLQPISKFNNAEVFKIKQTNPVREFGLVPRVLVVSSYKELFEQANLNINDLNSIIFTISGQNLNLKINPSGIYPTSNWTGKKISETKYYIKSSIGGERIVYLNKSFSPQWKLISNVQESDFDNSLLGLLKLYGKTYLSEDKHFVSNGYANGWIADGGNDSGIIFRPQILLEITQKVSMMVFAIVFVCLVIISLRMSRFFRHND